MEEGAEGLTAGHRRRLLLNQEEKVLAMRPVLPWHTFHSMVAVRKHTLSIGSKQGQTPSQIGFFHKLWRKPTHCSLHKVLGPRPFSHEFSTHFRASSSATVGSLRCSSQNADRVLFLPRMLSSRSGSLQSSPRILACLHFPDSFCFLGLLWLLHPHSPAHFFVGLIHLSPAFSFDAFVQRLTEGKTVGINQKGTPAPFCNVVDTDARLASSALSVNSRGFP